MINRRRCPVSLTDVIRVAQTNTFNNGTDCGLRKRRRVFWALLVALLATSIFSASAQQLGADAHSYGNHQQIRTQHLSLNLTVDFTRHQLSGYAQHQLQRLDPAVNKLVLDSRGLKIEKISQSADGQTWQPAVFLLGLADERLGQPLNIRLSAASQYVRVYYHTTEQASGLQWLNATQTTDKEHPFLYSQSQTIHARSWIPLQDTPAVRLTYDATIQVPPDLLAVMSANNTPVRQPKGIYQFDMPEPIPAYLIALAVGDLSFKAIGPNIGVYAEPSMLLKAAAEFRDAPKMMAAADAIFGNYPWQRYDLLVLPSSYPYGGMENPKLSFITSTIITGDRSLIGLLAHEMAHAWSGNLVSNASWDQVWLNEGFTNYVENRIMQQVYGDIRAELELEQYLQLLQNALLELPQERQKLLGNFVNSDPDDAFSPISYVKGQLFLTTLAKQLGQKPFEHFLANYFAKHAFQAVTSDEFIDDLLQHFPQQHALLTPLLEQWLHQSGMPEGSMQIVDNPFQQVMAAQKAWLYGEQQLTSAVTRNWSMQHWLVFLNLLPPEVSAEKLAELDAQFAFSLSTNAEIFSAFAKRAIAANYQPIILPLKQFLQRNGRLKFIQPLYQELKKQPQWRIWARGMYRANRDFYHIQARQHLDKLDL